MEQATTFLDALEHALRQAASYNPADQVAPAVVLWPDKERQWAPLLPELRQRLPLLTLGDYEPSTRTGPAYYLRCMIGRTLPEDLLSEEETPIIYLSGVSRQDLRALDECPRPLQPLAELQYRGVLWTHRNGRDWTVAAFLQNQEIGLGIDTANDQDTRDALLRALPVLAHEPLVGLRQQAPLQAPYLDGLLHPDEVRSLLLWMDDPQGYREQASTEEWAAFRQICRRNGLDPERDGELAAATLVAGGAQIWSSVWERYLEAPHRYPNLPDLLRRARPQRELFAPPVPYWPQDNEAAEADLRQALLDMDEQPPARVRERLQALEEEHGHRRDWVWARLGQAPLARALEHLVRMATMSANSLAGVDVASIAQAYAESGWQVDAAMMSALAEVKSSQDASALRGPIRVLYGPWLEASATAFQRTILGNPTANYVAGPIETPEPGTCILFSDALRHDLAQRLVGQLTEAGFACDLGWVLAALPTVTATAKPALIPELADGLTAGIDLAPAVQETGSPVNAERLRRLLRAKGYQVLAGDDTGDPAGRGWTELGSLDQYGHGHGWRIALHSQAELSALEQRICTLLNEGWQRIVVVTDHGWLLLPGGLPKAELPQHLTTLRKGRCAVLKEGASTDQSIVPWHWDPSVGIAVAQGIACYEAGKEYEHGGLSPQECVTPRLVVKSAQTMGAEQIEIKSLTWKGLRCQVALSGEQDGAQVDIRLRAGDATSSVAQQPKAPDAENSVSLVVPDDELIGNAAFVVVVAGDGSLCGQTHTTIGG